MDKYIGYIKPFDLKQNMAYRFISHQSLGDMFFHKTDLKAKFKLSQFTPDEIVVFSIRESSRVAGKFKGYDVELFNPELHSMTLLSIYKKL